MTQARSSLGGVDRDFRSNKFRKANEDEMEHDESRERWAAKLLQVLSDCTGRPGFGKATNRQETLSSCHNVHQYMLLDLPQTGVEQEGVLDSFLSLTTK